MGQRNFLADMDSDLHAAFADGGMADNGLYFRPQAAPDDVPVECRVYVDRDIATVGEIRQTVTGRIEIAYVLTDGFVPEQQGSVLVDGDRYENTRPVSDDGSLSRWMVRRVGA